MKDKIRSKGDKDLDSVSLWFNQDSRVSSDNCVFYEYLSEILVFDGECLKSEMPD